MDGAQPRRASSERVTKASVLSGVASMSNMVGPFSTESQLSEITATRSVEIGYDIPQRAVLVGAHHPGGAGSTTAAGASVHLR
ncbi:hypothetical protein Afil01_56380 [Actinorhabdospora filicis]|uniref:Uncharacterized protein n=1 Tax=Actinorhabdospora filicis TaxID=1785913 RepID=A0A9W6SU77_9ACTN|nr:hypothetical protein Afil01_56380 [Actinorhabdospora filicis]